MEYAEVIDKWGRKLLTERGFKVKDETRVDVELTYEVGGGCETCEYTEGVVNITAGKNCLQLTTYTFSEALDELIKIAAGE
jgi:hypothetical protein